MENLILRTLEMPMVNETVPNDSDWSKSLEDLVILDYGNLEQFSLAKAWSEAKVKQQQRLNSSGPKNFGRRDAIDSTKCQPR